MTSRLLSKEYMEECRKVGGDISSGAWDMADFNYQWEVIRGLYLGMDVNVWM